ncbi:MAG TPA: SRPBCC domain-containing protein [Polyangiaceae bacterium]|nr:SRPBCC domain-containing protein [Polyangiaceae bacterium]
MSPGSEGAAEQRKPLDLVITRVFNAPRHLVFEAWTKAEHVSRWFAPRPLTMSSCKVDFRPGGVFRFVMHAPDGTAYPFEGAFREIVAPARIVFTGTIHEGNATATTLTFAEHDGKTTLTMHQTYTFESDATRGAKQGWTMTLDQLGEHLEEA